MTPLFILLAIVTVVSAAAAMSLRSLVHCALCLVVTFAGIAGLFLELGAEFIAFAQVLVYGGAVSILIVFTILLTRGGGGASARPFSTSAWAGVAVAVLVAGSMIGMVLASGSLQRAGVAAPVTSARDIGERLMTRHVLVLEILGALLTAATIGAVVLAMRRRPELPGDPDPAPVESPVAKETAT